MQTAKVLSRQPIALSMTSGFGCGLCVVGFTVCRQLGHVKIPSSGVEAGLQAVCAFHECAACVILPKGSATTSLSLMELCFGVRNLEAKQKDNYIYPIIPI